ncbi:hypothetical protein SAMN05444004_11433 [Jannaschia faecimaris]|uniref:Succinate dehydrogenase n=1 Tax=Jannaschia faecimaris TaxID=1244108 RepID=A0A1H3SYB5_9RHOB|nr:hypothetical protein [Jannaschia faecimaris]SDZ42677.1 hypothetical protein SAMN05444004_11433 [Jannaschia faecimaris]
MRPSVLLILPVLAACNSPLADAVARDAAKRAVNPVVAARFPGVPLEPATNCIIDNASADEILTLATAAGAGANETATRIVLDVAARPDTIRCIATEGLPVLLNTL